MLFLKSMRRTLYEEQSNIHGKQSKMIPPFFKKVRGPSIWVRPSFLLPFLVTWPSLWPGAKRAKKGWASFFGWTKGTTEMRRDGWVLKLLQEIIFSPGTTEPQDTHHSIRFSRTGLDYRKELKQ